MRHCPKRALFLIMLAASACGPKDHKTARATDRPPAPAAPATPGQNTPRAADSQILRPDAATAAAAGAFLVQVQWVSGPSASADSTAKLTIADAQGHRAQTITDVAFNPWMPAMGHGTSMRNQTITAQPGQLGVYTVDRIDFIMGGDWQLQITATVNGHKDTANVPVKVP